MGEVVRSAFSEHGRGAVKDGGGKGVSKCRSCPDLALLDLEQRCHHHAKQCRDNKLRAGISAPPLPLDGAPLDGHAPVRLDSVICQRNSVSADMQCVAAGRGRCSGPLAETNLALSGSRVGRAGCIVG